MDDFKEVALIGTGLMGGSFALALKERNLSCKITGFDINQEALVMAKAMGVIDEIGTSLSVTVKKADLIMLAVPVGYYERILTKITEYVPKGAIITDLGSVKEAAVNAASVLNKGVQFVGGHPLAGSEKGGVEAASPYLFENAYYFLTPTADTSDVAVGRLKSLVSMIGAFPVIISPKKHDYIVARTSHLPHCLASVLTCMMEEEQDEELKNFAGSGFRDTTRIASGNPAMWEEIFFYNQRELLLGVEKFKKVLNDFHEYLSQGRRSEMLESLEKGKRYRDFLSETGKDYLPEWYQLYVEVKDEPGALAHITSLVGTAKANIKEIEIVHARESQKGAVRLAFAEAEEEKRAMKALGEEGFVFTRQKGEGNHVNRTSCEETKGEMSSSWG